MRNTIHPPTAEETWFPLQWLNLERGTGILRIPAPLLRIHACGMLRVEILCQVREDSTLEGRYQSLSEEQMRGRNGAQALTLLKLLLSRPHRHAPKPYLMEYLGHGEQAISEGRLDDLVTKLRSLLCPQQWEHLRTHLVQHVHSSAATGNGYRLDSYPLIWLDTDALAWCVEQAVRLERHGEPELACVLWERAYHLSSRGDYLSDEEYADWAESKRAEVARGRRASVHALSRLLVASAGAAGEVQVLHLLSAYCAQYPLDEDALRPLLELLGKHERFGEALALYERACTLLSEDGLSPDERTSDIAQVLRSKELHRQNVISRGDLEGEVNRKRGNQFVAVPLPLMPDIHHHVSSDLLQQMYKAIPDGRVLAAYMASHQFSASPSPIEAKEHQRPEQEQFSLIGQIALGEGSSSPVCCPEQTCCE